MIEIAYSVKLEEPDRRYRMMVLLGREDRPTHYKFHCPRCTMPVAELVNSEVLAITDMVDMDNVDTYGIGFRCDGRFEGGKCSMWYYFTMGK